MGLLVKASDILSSFSTAREQPSYSEKSKGPMTGVVDISNPDTLSAVDRIVDLVSRPRVDDEPVRVLLH